MTTTTTTTSIAALPVVSAAFALPSCCNKRQYQASSLSLIRIAGQVAAADPTSFSAANKRQGLAIRPAGRRLSLVARKSSPRSSEAELTISHKNDTALPGGVVGKSTETTTATTKSSDSSSGGAGSGSSNRSMVGIFAVSLLTLVSIAAKTGLLPANILADGTFELYTNGNLLRDAGSATLAGVLAYFLVTFITHLAADGVLEPQDSRKAIHTISAPAYMLVWPLFSSASIGARVFAATIPLINAARLYVAAQTVAAAESDTEVQGDSESRRLAAAVSRTGDSSEAVGGPLIYVLILFLGILLFWRDSPHAVVALSAMAAGDGSADLIGRRFGLSNPWPAVLTGPDNRKSIAGSTAFVVSSVVTAFGLLTWLQTTGCMTSTSIIATLTPVELVMRLLVICTVSAFLELLPFVDDNYTVPVSAALLSVLLL